MSLPSPIYPVLERFVEEQPEEEDHQNGHRSQSPQENTLLSSFDVNSIAASSTPIAETVIHKRKTRSSPNLNDTTYMAGNLPREDEDNRIAWAEDHSSTNTTSCSDYYASQCFSRMIDDFRACSSNGGWLQFFWKHHLVILGTLCIVLVVASLLKGFYGISHSDRRAPMWKTYQKEIRRLHKDKLITKGDTNTLLVMGQQWIVDERPEPTVLIIGGKSSEVLAKKFMNIVNKVSSEQSLYSVIEGNNELDRSKLHNILYKSLANRLLPVAVVTGIDRLSWDAPLVLHAFADSDTFPVKNTLLVLAIKDLPEKATNCEEAIQDHLLDRWISAGGINDNVTPVLSRILGHTVCF